jgi:hypothetical protein
MKRVLLFSLLLIVGNSQAQNVGIGNSSPAEKLDVTGNINVTGTIKANGVDGTPNQVLMKNNAGNLEWGSQAFTEKVRFYFQGDSFGAVLNDSLLLNTTVYNLSPASIVKTGKYITINKAGLYHFELYYGSVMVLSGQANPPMVTLTLLLNGLPTQAYYCIAAPYQLVNASVPQWRFNLHESKEVYIPAGTKVAVRRQNENITGSSLDHYFIFSGHLISE